MRYRDVPLNPRIYVWTAGQDMVTWSVCDMTRWGCEDFSRDVLIVELDNAIEAALSDFCDGT